MKKEKQKGFTLVEVLLVVAIMSIIVTVSLSSWQSFSDATALGDTAKMIETKIKLAKNYSLSSWNDKKYGVRFEADKITLFLVNSDDTTADVEAYNLSASIEIYGITLAGVSGNKAVFNRLTGTTDNIGSVKIRIATRPEHWKQIFINTQGQTGTDIFGVSAIPAIVEDTTNNINARHIHFNLSAWNIQSNPPITKLIFRKLDNTLIGTEIDTASYFNAGIFDWQGTITVDSVEQKLRIHTMDTSGTTLCIMRDRMQNSKSLKISFYDNGAGTEKTIVTYTENVDGSVTVAPNTPTWVTEMISQ